MAQSGICALCKTFNELCESHLLPRSMYRRLRSKKATDKSPLLVASGQRGTTSKQLKKYLLCGVCEHRFNKHGESWVLANTCQPDGTFPLDVALKGLTPHFDCAGMRGFVGVPGTSDLIYFGASVFWRASVTEWSLPWGDAVHARLGPYEEDLRQYLLHAKPFPSAMVLHIRIRADHLQQIAKAPESRREDGFHSHRFIIPGVAFELFAGQRMPAEITQFCAVQNGIVFIAPEFDRAMLQAAARDSFRARKTGRKAALLPAPR